MGDKSRISWTDATWNPIAGCSPVSEGCRNCYAAREAVRLAGNPHPKVSGAYAGTAEMRGAGARRRAVFTGRVNLLEDRLDQPLRWKRPRRIFVNSMSDLFHEGVPEEFITRVFTVMAQPIDRSGPIEEWRRHTFQILTKRPDRAADFLSRLRWRWATRDGGPWKMRGAGDRMISPIAVLDGWGDPTPAPNIWMGTSVENQEAADERVPHLLRTPAAVRFLSCEPLLGPVDLTDLVVDDGRPGEWHVNALELDVNPEDDAPFHGATIHQVIVGGESGPRARPMHPDWARSLRDQCHAAGVAFHFKQWGEWRPYHIRPGGDLGGDVRSGRAQIVHPGGESLLEVAERTGGRSTLPGSCYMARVGKKAAGRELDGRTWNEEPSVSHSLRRRGR